MPEGVQKLKNRPISEHVKYARLSHWEQNWFYRWNFSFDRSIKLQLQIWYICALPFTKEQ